MIENCFCSRITLKRFLMLRTSEQLKREAGSRNLQMNDKVGDIEPTSFGDSPVRPGKYDTTLKIATEAAQEAGKLLLAEFLRPGGPRGPVGSCLADKKAELEIRRKLGDSFPDYGIYGEEAPEHDRPPADKEKHTWVIDPNDGTAAFQQGFRGAAVSIGLLGSGKPVLGVVYAYGARANRGDMITWAEGEPLRRNGQPVELNPKEQVDETGTVFVSQAADENPLSNAQLCYPARYRAVPSIAYRLALVAAGEGVAAVSLASPVSWDVIAGHALLHAVGYELYDMSGTPITYSPDGTGDVGDCIGGVPHFAKELTSRDWTTVFQPQPQKDEPYSLVWPEATKISGNWHALDRAQGCLIGQLAGDSLGSLVEFQSSREIQKIHPSGPRNLEDGGFWNTLGGQPTDDSELALMLARSIVESEGYNQEAAAKAYVHWYTSDPFDIGNTTSSALSPARFAVETGHSIAEAACQAASSNLGSQANGALMRISPLGIFGYRLDDDSLATLAREDARLTHANQICQDANAVFCVAIAAAIRNAISPQEVYDYAYSWATSRQIESSVRATLDKAKESPPADYLTSMGWVLIALQNAFFQLLHASGPEEALVRTVASGGDTDTNGAIAGALIGATYGTDKWPSRWIDRILTCRPLSELSYCETPRPVAFWPVDCCCLAERLVWLGDNIKR
jgi:ADP-ribosylglycohydrolase/fructose-1,6-bisphosphatase/inositol monophosphatase family enzyme